MKICMFNNTYKPHVGGVARSVNVVPTGVDLNYFSGGRRERFCRGHQIPLQAPVVDHLGRMAPEKNLDYLSRAITAFMEDRPDSRFLVVGDGPRRLDIQRHFERSDRADRLILAGELSRPYLADAYKAMDLFVFASKCETQGMVLVEVMAAGKPVIALDAFGCREVVVDGKNSRLLSENADEKEFARTVAAFFDHPEKRRRWSARAGETPADFSREVCARELAKVCRAAGADTEKRLDSGPQELSV